MVELEDKFITTEEEPTIIKVVGVGGGGSNAVSHMYKQNIKNVSFVICNTDDQALQRSAVPNRIQLGSTSTSGLGAGNKPAVAQKAAEESRDEIKNMLDDGTKMVFITAGMGGGTGTGASPIVASIAKEMDILTIGIVTIPFAFEGKPKILQALKGVVEMSKHVDALLVINNEKLRTIYPDLDLTNAFALADDVLTNAAKGIAEIITIEGYINVDFADVSTILKNGGVAIMNSGLGEGENRVNAAIQNALESPLLNNNDVHNSKKILFNFYCSTTHPIKISEVGDINEFMSHMGDDIEVIWGISYDDTLGDKVKVTLLATGANIKIVPDDLLAELQNKEKNQAVENLEKGDSESTNEGALRNVNQPSELTKWASELYGGKLDKDMPQVNISVDKFDDDDEIFKQMETEPAILRTNKYK